MDRLPKLHLAAIWSSGLFVTIIAALAAGCAHSDKHKLEDSAAALRGMAAPELPAFLNGSMSLLLTNVDGFRARVVLEGQLTANRGDVVAGELMGRAGKLLFAPAPGGSVDKHFHAEDFSYIWDVSENRGFLLSGPLQGYAPISSNARFTNVVTGASEKNLPPEKFAGHPCQQADVTVVSGDGVATVWHVWRATDLKGMPLRITGAPNGIPLTLSLSKIRLQAPPNDLFSPPDGFTKHASAEGMVNELAAREHNLKRKPGYEPPLSDEIGFRDAHAPTRQQP